MKKLKYTFITIMYFLSVIPIMAQNYLRVNSIDAIPKVQYSLDYNRIRTFIHNTGTFNRNINQSNAPGFEWPKGSGKHAIFTSGLTVAGYVNGYLRMAAASYSGEYQPGIISSINGILTPFTDNTFKIYKVSKYDECRNNPDWANWGLMVPYGAPYEDINNNAQFDPCIDIPGVIGAGQTVFVCLIDAFPENHNASEGFGGGTIPMNIELRLTAWAFDIKFNGLEDAQFIRFQAINKNNASWDSTRFAIFCDVDLGDAGDDYIGCDSIKQIGYCYNSTNMDGGGIPGTYGLNPPAVGIRFLKTIKNKRSLSSEENGMTSFCYMKSPSSPGPTCERDPDNPKEAYNYMNSIKSDGSIWINPLTRNPTKFTYNGNPDTKEGWSEFDGKIGNCNGVDTGTIVPSPGGNRTFLMSTGKNNLTINPLDTMEIIITQLIAKGSNNLNSVTQLLKYSDRVAEIFDHIYIDPLYIKNINPEIPSKYFLSNNYPNPFNPITKIDYSIPKDFEVDITVYDVLGNKVAVIHKGMQKTGNYSVQFNGSNFASGVYFLKMKSGSFIQTRRMMLLK